MACYGAQRRACKLSESLVVSNTSLELVHNGVHSCASQGYSHVALPPTAYGAPRLGIRRGESGSVRNQSNARPGEKQERKAWQGKAKVTCNRSQQAPRRRRSPAHLATLLAVAPSDCR